MQLCRRAYGDFQAHAVGLLQQIANLRIAYWGRRGERRPFSEGSRQFTGGIIRDRAQASRDILKCSSRLQGIPREH